MSLSPATRFPLFPPVLLALLVSLCAVPVFSQNPSAKVNAMLAGRDSAVARLFEQPADIRWFKRFKGRMDDAAVVDVHLGFDGRSCRGYLTYSKSNVRIRLDGSMPDTTRLMLEERDGKKNRLATLSGSLKNHLLQAEWANHDNSLGSRLEAREVMPGQVLTVSCADSKWAYRYLGRYNEDRVDMVLVRMHHDRLYGFLWVEADKKTYSLQGGIDDEGNYEITALSAGGKVSGRLNGSLKVLKNTDCNWVGSGERRVFKLVQGPSLPFNCQEYADFRSSFDAVYPRTPCTACNTWLDQQMKTWTDRCKSFISARTEPPSPQNRAANRASAWAELSTWTDNLLCGYLTFTETWNDQAQGASFNFDLKAGRMLLLEDLFSKGFNARGWLEDYAKRESPKLPQFAADPKYREWIVKEGFPLFTIRRDGLEISTLFHPQYGRQSLMIPYAALKTYLKKDNPAAEFIK
ncbi:MAG TPA: hypothetical protein PK971_11705 [Saprospiraceae bacterium]|nr:hypothetical protein [Saprospiraceae bacterium]HND88989.1 hypothetical protein [Saprospiraceae bacterium]